MARKGLAHPVRYGAPVFQDVNDIKNLRTLLDRNRQYLESFLNSNLFNFWAIEDNDIVFYTWDGIEVLRYDDSADKWSFSLGGSESAAITSDGLELEGEPAGVWQDWTPVLTASGTDPTLGTGSLQEGRFTQIGKLVSFTAAIHFGSSGVNKGSGFYFVSLPVTAAMETDGAPEKFTTIGGGTVVESGVGRSPGLTYLASTAAVQLWIPSDSHITVPVSSANPFIFGENDRILVSGTYEAA